MEKDDVELSDIHNDTQLVAETSDNPEIMALCEILHKLTDALAEISHRQDERVTPTASQAERVPTG